MNTSQQPEALRLADKYEAHGFLGDHRFAQEHWCRQAASRIEELEEQLSAIGVELLHKQVVVPQGWKLVPVEPTEKMISEGGCAQTLKDGHRYIGECAAKTAWSFMLAAAPQPPACNLFSPGSQ